MCTVTYVPQPDGFILTANRDEFPDREPAHFPEKIQTERGEVTFPKDGNAGGTWIASSSELTVSLLNGSYERGPEKTFSRSRGLVALEPFGYKTLEEFLEKADFTGVNGFKLRMMEKDRILALDWDGKVLTLEKFPSDQAHIWVSIPKKFQHILNWRRDAFLRFLANNPNPDPEKIRAFHQIKSDPTGLGTQIVKNDLVYTVSLTQFHHSPNGIESSYCSFR